MNNTSQPLVYIILVNYKGYEDTMECINSLRAIDYNNYKIVVVDNASGDGSYERLRDENPDCTVILSDENNGFAAGNNIGIKYAFEGKADYVLLLNNDTVVKTDFLSRLIERAGPMIVVIPTIYYYDYKTEIWSAATTINYNRCTVNKGDNRASKWVDYAGGCCFLISSWLIKEIGFLAEEYFMYYEDMDYSLRICRVGAKIWYNNEAVVYHKAGKTAGRESKLSIYYNTRNRFIIISRFHFSWRAQMYSYFTRLLRYLQGIVMRNSNVIILRAVKDYYHGIRGKVNI